MKNSVDLTQETQSDSLLFRNAALSLRTMAAMIPASTLRDSAMFYADRLSLKAKQLEKEKTSLQMPYQCIADGVGCFPLGGRTDG
jgi:hypothetical protein